MKKIKDLKLGFNDAENYKKRQNKSLFNKIFVKNIYLDQLLEPDTYFLIGEKGTGKTAYSVFLANNYYKNNISELKYIRETDYQKFILLKQQQQLSLSDYSSIWRVIILLLISKSIKENELDHFSFSKSFKLRKIMQAVDDYYQHAFSPEILSVLNFIENSKFAAELISKYLKVGDEEQSTISFSESRFQINLMYIQRQFEEALSVIKLKDNHLLFIDGIDIRPGKIPYEEYLECIKGLANATWAINNDFFANIRDSKGRFKVILLLRPDIFNSIGLQNLTNKIRDNSVFLDWRTTYPSYRTSSLFELADKLLLSQQEEPLQLGEAWDHYFPWKSPSTSPDREFDPAFIKFLRLSYSRPRDIVTMLHILKEEQISKGNENDDQFKEKIFESDDFLNKYSEYLMGGIKDQLAFYYNENDYNMFLKFFNFLDGRDQFSYDEFVDSYKKFVDYVLENHDDIPQFVESESTFLQFLYDANIICYIEETENYQRFFRWCYRERSPSNISPKVKLNKYYNIHYGLKKALNVGTKLK